MVTTPSHNRLIMKRIFIFAFLFASLFAAAQSVGTNFEISKSIDIYNAVFRELNLNYVDEINPGELNKVAIDAMLKQLDPYTNFIPESDIEDYKLMTTGEYGGIGAVIQYFDEYVHISEPYFDYPAQKAGLIAGDAILEVNGIDVHKKLTPEVSELLKGQPGSEVKLKIKRYGEKNPITVTLVRQKIKIDNIPFFKVFDNGIGYISLSGFTQNAAKELKTIIVDMKEKDRIKGLVIDLRGNGGGLLEEAVDIVNLFVPKNQLVVSKKGKNQRLSGVHKTKYDPVDLEIPLAIMVNGASASASEIVSGAIQDFDRGVIIGQRTFGKGLVQNILPMTYNTQIKVTIAKYYIPSGRCIQEIDYSKKKNDTIAKPADTIGNAFRTLHGRTVYEGHGIMPDVVIKPEMSSLIAANLYAQNMVFKYANKYYNEHKTIASPAEFTVSDDEYGDFVEFVKSQDFKYKTESEAILEDLKKNAKREDYYEKMKTVIEQLETELTDEKAQDIMKYKDEICELLQMEIVERYYYQKGAIEKSLSFDPELKRAFEILLDKSEYEKILKPNN